MATMPVHDHDYDPGCAEKIVAGYGLVGVCLRHAAEEASRLDFPCCGVSPKDHPAPIPDSGLADSGQRVQVGTGAVRERAAGKGRFDLISPVTEQRLAMHMEAGAIKYGNGRNWEAGLPLSFYVDATKRHLGQYLQGETDEDHLAAALWNVHCLLHTDEMIRRGVLPGELNDLPGTVGAYAALPAPEPRPGAAGVLLSNLCQPDRFLHTDGRICERLQRPDEPVRWMVAVFGDGSVPTGSTECGMEHA